MAGGISRRLCHDKELPDWLSLAQLCESFRQHGRAAFFCKLDIAQELGHPGNKAEADYMLRVCAEMLRQDLESKLGIDRQLLSMHV